MRSRPHRIDRLIVIHAVVLTACALVLAAPVPASETGTIEFFPELAQTGQVDPVSVSFRGTVYDPGFWLSRAEDGQLALDDEETRLREIVAVNADGGVAEILALWNPAERAELETQLRDPALLERSRGLYRQIDDTALLARVHYGDYVVFVVQHSGRQMHDLVHVYPLKKVGRSIVMSNELQDDPMLNFFYFVYREKTPLQAMPARP